MTESQPIEPAGRRPASPNRKVLIWSLAGFALVAMILLLLLPAFIAYRQKMLEVDCVNNLRLIGLAYFNYTADHDRKTPRTLDDLLSYGLNTNTLICPAAKDRTRFSYELIPVKIGHVSPDSVVVREIEPNHYGCRNELYTDGHASLKCRASP